MASGLLPRVFAGSGGGAPIDDQVNYPGTSSATYSSQKMYQKFVQFVGPGSQTIAGGSGGAALVLSGIDGSLTSPNGSFGKISVQNTTFYQLNQVAVGTNTVLFTLPAAVNGIYAITITAAIYSNNPQALKYATAWLKGPGSLARLSNGLTPAFNPLLDTAGTSSIALAPNGGLNGIVVTGTAGAGVTFPAQWVGTMEVIYIPPPGSEFLESIPIIPLSSVDSEMTTQELSETSSLPEDYENIDLKEPHERSFLML